MMNRRHFLRVAGAAPILALSGGAGLAAASDYRAVICLFLGGGNDGHNSLVPTDGAYDDYYASRPGLALAKTELKNLPGSSAGHTFGLNPALAPLLPAYAEGRMAWLLNAGPLVMPATAQQVKERSVVVPSFLLSHSDQVMWQQGWLGDADGSGWGGRAMELMPSSLRNPMNAVTMNTNRTLVLGRNSPVSFIGAWGSRHWGPFDLAQQGNDGTQALMRMAQWQYGSQYSAEYARTFGRSLQESALVTQATMNAPEPNTGFDNDELGRGLRRLGTVLPVFKKMGYKRQLFMLQWGGFDTHSAQRGSAQYSQDYQLAQVARNVAALDAANKASGVDGGVVLLIMSDFGRTLRMASGNGSDHAWGNNWFVLGTPVAGGQVYGTLPTLRLGGVDDADPGGEGRFVPSMATDQVGATLMRWLGLPADQLTAVFPNLANFSTKTLNFLHA
ncbi:DUF1501 domain-containing protein [Pseudoduganella sp. OTU4001]|uniref:DUF1501 domain-containing protein n=1 Tax=Pseudoduganella sp. OTU4001 TaxID=3043854 RepID=UPI00313A8D64